MIEEKNISKILLNNLNDAFAYYKVILDDKGRPVDSLLMEVNPAFEEMTGLKRYNVIGKNVIDVLPEIKDSEFDWISTFGKVALTGKSISFKQYFEPLDRWYKVRSFSDEPGYFAVIFKDISQSKKEKESIEKIIKSSEKFLQPSKEVDYEEITDIFMEISGAKYVAFNLYDEDGEVYTTLTVSGIDENFKKAVDLLGFNPIGKNWPHDQVRAEKIKGKTKTSFSCLSELTGDVISKSAVKMLEKNFKLGEVVLIKIIKDNIMIGDFTFLMASGVKIKNTNLVEVYTKQVGLFITRKKSENLALEKTEELEDFFNVSQDLLCITDEKGKFIKVNKASRKILGYSPEKLEKKKFLDFVHTDDVKATIVVMSKPLKQKKVINLTNRFKCKDGKYKYIEWSIYPKGKLIYIAARDITDRKQAEQEIKQYQYIVENMQVGLHVYHLENFYNNRSLRMIVTNPAATLHTGLKMDDILGKTIDEVYPKLSPMGISRRYADVVRTGKSIELDNIYYNDHRGVEVYFSIKAFPLPNDCVGVAFENITERKKAEEALRESERSKSVLLSNIPGMSYRCRYDRERTMDFVSEGCYELTGYKLKELIYNSFISFNEIILPEYQEHIWKTWENAVSFSEPVRLEYPICTANQRVKWVLEQGVPIYDDEGKVEALEGIIIDITNRKKAEKDLFEQAQRQELAAQLSTSFLNQSLNHIDTSINNVLEMIGNIIHANRCYMVEFSDDKKMIFNIHEWCSKDVKLQVNTCMNQTIESMPWLYEQIMNKKTVSIKRVSDLPLEAAVEKQKFQQHFVKSFLCIPTIIEDKVIGFIGADAIWLEKQWDENDTLILQIVGSIITSAVKRGRLERELTHLTFHDQVTSLYNRTFFEEEIRRLDTDRQLPFSIIMADVNGLKLVNDTYGHNIGDEILVKCAEVLKKSCREEDIIARWGGDEFVILLPQTTAKVTSSICERIISKCNETYVQDIPISMALGFATKISGKKDIADILKEAENKMYKNKLTESRSAKSTLLNALLKTLEEKSYETKEHVRRMQEMSHDISEKLGLPESERSRLYLLISLHDIGKINISEEILTKKGSLTKEEWEIIKKHPEIGYRIARSTEEFAHVADDILCHHEKWDGTGYPRGISGKEIPLLAKVTAIVDAYEVMSNGRPYKRPLSKEEIIEEFKDCAGKQFDPELVELFLEILEEKNT